MSSRGAIRGAIAAYFSPTNLSAVSTTFRARPKIIPAQAYGLAEGGGSGAVLIVHMTKDPELRRATGGLTSGEKYTRHAIALEIRFQSTKDDAMSAQDDYDTLVQSLFDLIHQDRTLGTGGGATGAVWQAGEGPAGIDHQQSEPVLTKQVTRISGVFKFEAWEWVQA